MAQPPGLIARRDWLRRLLPAALLTCLLALYNRFPLTYFDTGAYLLQAQALTHGYLPVLFDRPPALIATVWTGLLANALVIGSLGSVLNRYQSGVVWLLPLAAIIAAARVAEARSWGSAAVCWLVCA